MIGVALMFTGAVLLVNGLALIGRADAGSVAVFNLIGGTLDAGVAVWSGIDHNTFAAGQVFLFAFTYLWMAWNALTGQADWRAFGWYCGFVAVMALPTAFVNLGNGVHWFGSFWLCWAALWYLFFLMFGVGVTVTNAFAGLSTIAIGVATAMIPGYLLTSGTWAGG